MAQSTPQPEPLGERIARLRTRRNWTQSELAERLAASRVAVSHFEAGLATPSERTVVLMAALFGLEPLELVEGSNYPQAKAERLPLAVPHHTRLDMDLAILERDLEWLARLKEPVLTQEKGRVQAEWQERLTQWMLNTEDMQERQRVREALERIKTWA